MKEQQRSEKAEQYQAYEKSPIYRRARELLRHSHIVTARMSRTYKHSLGVKLSDAASSLAESIFLAYEEKDNLSTKLFYIEQIIKYTQRLLINYRIAKDLALLPLDIYGEQVESIICVIKQSKGWEQSTRNQLISNGI